MPTTALVVALALVLVGGLTAQPAVADGTFYSTLDPCLSQSATLSVTEADRSLIAVGDKKTSAYAQVVEELNNHHVRYTGSNSVTDVVKSSSSGHCVVTIKDVQWL